MQIARVGGRKRLYVLSAEKNSKEKYKSIDKGVDGKIKYVKYVNIYKYVNGLSRSGVRKLFNCILQVTTYSI